MLDCPRVALAAKLYPPEHRNTAEALNHQITFQRGHWFETGVHQALIGYGLSLLSQLEIEIVYGDVLLKAHLDFTLVTDQPHPVVRILEVKSTAKLPTTLSESYLMQIGAQTALLKAYWNHPVFNIIQETGEVLYHRTLPEICKELLGVSLSDDASACDIQGWIGNINGGEDNMPLINWLRKVKRLKVSSFDLRLRRALSLTPNVNSN